MTQDNLNHTATYSPEDNKLRLYPDYRLDKEEYSQMRANGFIWAPKQELFVAPKWTPEREDFLIEWCGEIGDEDTSLVDRAEMRAGRFEEYSEKRGNDAHAAKEYVASIADHIPMGQPILVGHHSEKRARKDAERIRNGMQKAVKMWETSKYWKMRAKGALHHAKYKERPDVRARRIKKIEAESRKYGRTVKESKMFLNLWLHPSILTKEKALYIGNFSHSYFKFPLDKYPRELPISQYEGDMSLWSALDDGIINAIQARNIHVPLLERTINHYSRWIGHCRNRLIYEKAMLDEQGGSDLLKPKKRPKQLPLKNYKAPEGISIENIYHKGQFDVYSQIEMTKAEYAKIWRDYKGTRKVENSHRVRIAMVKMSTHVVFLTDSKTHKKPDPVEVKKELPSRIPSMPYTPPERTEFDDMKDSLKKGVQTVSAPQLFPTPKELAGKMADLLNVSEGESVLEPSAGTGALIGAVGCRWYGTGGKAVLVEINSSLCEKLEHGFPKSEVINQDFLSCNGDLGKFDKILMNPPFINGSDIKHIKHAMDFLEPGGRLVALCANGPRQQKELKPLADTWEELPQGTFKMAGTMVNTALLTIKA